MSFKCSDKIKISDRMLSRYFIIINPYMTDTMFELPVASEVDTEEYAVDFDNLKDIDVVLAFRGLSDAERLLIISKGDDVIEYAAKYIREDAKTGSDHLVEFVDELVRARREANRALGIRSEL